MSQHHRTPTTLDLATRVGRLTLGHVAAILVGGLTLLGLGQLTAGVHDLGHHFALVVFPTILVCAPILALTRGGIERYPQQSARYAGRLIARTSGQAARASAYYAGQVARTVATYTVRYARFISRKGREGYDACRTWARQNRAR